MVSIFPEFCIGTAQSNNGGATGSTQNAAGESSSAIGFVRIPGGGTKTLSAAGGGSILLRATSATFSNGSTSLSVGIQDVDPSTGFEDGTFDVRCDAVGGAFTINTPGITEFLMTNDSKSITDGDLIAIVSEMTARGGTDSLVFRKVANQPNNSSFPYGTTDIGTGLIKSNSGLAAWIRFDDGSVGWIDYFSPWSTTATATQAFNSGSGTPEYGATFEVPITIEIISVGLQLSDIALADTFQIKVYKDPYGTPILLDTITPNLGLIDGSTGVTIYSLTAPLILTPGEYAITCLATSANDVSIGYLDLGSGFEELKQGILMFSETAKFAGVAGGTFTEVQTYFIPQFLIAISGLNSGGIKPVGSGGLAG